MSLFSSFAPQNQNKPGLFGSSTATATQPQQNTGLGGSLFGQPQQQQQQQTQQGGGLFGASAQQPAQTNSLFGASAQPQQGGGLFGQSQQQQQQQQQPQGAQNSVFGGSILNQSQALPKLGSVWQQPNGNPSPREKPVTDQMQILFQKWNPESSETVFQQYLYNNVDANMVPFYGPGPGEDGKKWEEALANKPSETAVPVLVKGFKDVAQRLTTQTMAINTLRVRCHEINDALNRIIQEHDLKISVRTAEAKRRHVALSQRCLSLATKVQVLRNRGYAMDPAEEELKKKLSELERRAFDPVLGAKAEEVWARMTGIRARADFLQKESEKLGKHLGNGDEETLDEETMKTIKKILSDYDSQLSHLAKELKQITDDYNEWEAAATTDRR